MSWDRGTPEPVGLILNDVLSQHISYRYKPEATIENVCAHGFHKVCNSVCCQLCSSCLLLFRTFQPIAEKVSSHLPKHDGLNLLGVVAVAAADKIGFALWQYNFDHSLTLPVVAGLTCATNDQFCSFFHLVSSLFSTRIPPAAPSEIRAAGQSNNGVTHWIAARVPTRFSVGACGGVEGARGVRLSLILIAERFRTECTH